MSSLPASLQHAISQNLAGVSAMQNPFFPSTVQGSHFVQGLPALHQSSLPLHKVRRWQLTEWLKTACKKPCVCLIHFDAQSVSLCCA